MVLLWVDETLPKEEREEKLALAEQMKLKMSGILRKRDREESLDEEEHVLMLMSQNNYFSMFKDKLIVITVMLYGTSLRLRRS